MLLKSDFIFFSLITDMLKSYLIYKICASDKMDEKVKIYKHALKLHFDGMIFKKYIYLG